jgi:hypothetical protein
VEQELPSIEVPSELQSLPDAVSGGILNLVNSDVTVPSGDYKLRRLNIATVFGGSSTLTVQAPARIYLTGAPGLWGDMRSLFMAGNARIRIQNADPYADPPRVVEFYFDEAAVMAGPGVVNESQQPPSLFIFGTDTCDDIDLVGDTTFYGSVYAPQADIDFFFGGEAYGSITGKELNKILGFASAGGGGFHYDKALEEFQISVPGGSYGYTQVSWQEIIVPRERPVEPEADGNGDNPCPRPRPDRPRRPSASSGSIGSPSLPGYIVDVFSH